MGLRDINAMVIFGFYQSLFHEDVEMKNILLIIFSVLLMADVCGQCWTAGMA
jgi:hypothetical protein